MACATDISTCNNYITYWYTSIETTHQQITSSFKIVIKKE